MTVVAYDGREMVSDSLMSGGNLRLGSVQKVYKLKSGALMGTAGGADSREVLETFDLVENPSQFPSLDDLRKLKSDFQGILVLPDRTVYFVDIWCDEFDPAIWSASIIQTDSKCATAGSGGEIALTVLQTGGTALDAVKAAIKLDIFCGGPIQRMSLETPVKVKKTKKPKAVVFNEPKKAADEEHPSNS